MKTIYWFIFMPLLILLATYIVYKFPLATVHKDLQRSSAGLMYSMVPSLNSDPAKQQQVISEVENTAEHTDPTHQGHRVSSPSPAASKYPTTSKTGPTNHGDRVSSPPPESSKYSTTNKTGPINHGHRVSSPSLRASKYPTTSKTAPTNHVSSPPSSANKYPSTLADSKTDNHRGGYVLSQNYWEQMTAGARNLLTLQCWAARLNMSVVEPFIKRSDLYFPTSDDKVKDLPRFGEAYDLDHWNAQNQKAPLTSWEQFIKRAPRNLIAVNIRYDHPTGTVSTSNDVLHRQGCKDSQSWNNLVRFLKSKGFTVRRKVCMNFQYKDELNESNFHEEIFADSKPSDSTVLFGQWRGLHNRRMYQTHSGCEKLAELKAVPSKQVYLDAKKYAERYLRTRNYLSIFLRMEKAMNVMEEKQTGTVSTCFHETLDYWHTMVSKTGLNTTVLSSDIGKLGSKSLLVKKSSVDGPFSKFLKAIYGRTLTIKEWENTFRSISRSPQAGYIAMLQKAIAANAKCVLFVGGGSFQRNALELYKKTHAEQDWCIQFVKNCTSMKS